ncbi:MAG: T9SS type A sorting domain-containing protein [Janthinobacterium lividum]
MHKKIHFYTAVASLLLASQVAQAQGQGYVLDPTFGSGGKVLAAISTPPTSTNVLLDVEQQPASQLLVLAKGTSGLVKIRFNADGSLDTSYGTAGQLILASLPAGITPSSGGGDKALAPSYDLLPDGRVLVSGASTTASGTLLLALYQANGTVDTSFGTQGVLSLGTKVSDYALLPSGKVVVASSTDVTTQVGSFSGGQMKITQLAANGTLEFTTLLDHILIAPASSPGRQAIVVGTELVIQADGKILAIGTGTERYSTSNFMTIARLLPNGTPDASFGTQGTLIAYYSSQHALSFNNVRSSVPLPDGKFLVNVSQSAPANSGYQFTIMRFTAAGQLDVSYGNQGLAQGQNSQGPNVAYPMRLQPDNSLLLGGATYLLNAIRLTSAGQLDLTFAPTGSANPYNNPYISVDYGRYRNPSNDSESFMKMLVQPDNSLIFAGNSYSSTVVAPYPAGSLISLARFKPSSVLATNAPRPATPSVTVYPNPLTEASMHLHLADWPGTTPLTATLYNAVGQVVSSQLVPAQAGTTTHTLPLPVLPSGIYQLRLAGGQWGSRFSVAVP